MTLSTKYILGSGAIAAFVLVPEVINFGVFTFFIQGIGIMITGLFFLYLLFSKETIRGYNLEFEASPDLKYFEIKNRHSGIRSNQEVEIPDTAFCAACGNKVYKPFRCQACGQLLCGKHYLRGDHKCVEDRQ